jgi:hypothetical protein
MKVPTTSSAAAAASRSIQSADALRQFFALLESRYGGLPIDQGDSSQVIVSTNGLLRPQDLQRLVSHEATALHVKNFYPRAASLSMGGRLAKEALTGKVRNWKVSTARGLESSDVFTLGAHAPFNVASANPNKESINAYFEGVQQELHQRRRTTIMEEEEESSSQQQEQLQLWPLDKLRLELDEAWPAGAGLARDAQGRPFGGGLPRVMLGPTRWQKGFIHVDEMAPLSPTEGLFSANIYLQLPELPENSEQPQNVTDTVVALEPQPILQVWPVGIRSRWDWYRVSVKIRTQEDVQSYCWSYRCICICFHYQKECHLVVGIVVAGS